MPGVTEIRLQGPPYDGDTEIWDGTLGQWVLTSGVISDGNTVYVSSTGSDKSTGLSWAAAKLTLEGAIAALPTGGTIELGAGATTSTNIVPAAGTVIRGRGRGITTLNFPTDTGTNTYAIDCSASTNTKPIRLESLTITGPATTFTIGSPPANMTGVRIGSVMVMRDVVVQKFYAGITTGPGSNHETFYNVLSTNNYYNLYWTTLGGNQVFVQCDFTGAALASVACSPNGGFDSTTWIRTHVGVAPVGFYKETGAATNPQIFSDSTADIAFESCGNACILDANTGASGPTLTSVTFYNPVFAVQGSAGPDYYSGLPAAACVNIDFGSFKVVGDGNSVAAPGGAIYKATAGSTVDTDRAPTANDFAGTTQWVGSTHRFVGSNGLSIATQATVMHAGAAVSAGQVLQVQGAQDVKPFGSDNSFSYIGVAAYAVSSGSPVAVVTSGMVSILSSTAVPFFGIRMEIDPATPAQVRAVNADLGVGVAPTTQVPSYYPVIGISVLSCSANSLLLCVIQSPYTDPAYTNPAHVTALPGASSTYKGQMLMVPGNGTTTADILYVCLMSAAGVYNWKQIVSG